MQTQVKEGRVILFDLDDTLCRTGWAYVQKRNEVFEYLTDLGFLGNPGAWNRLLDGIEKANLAKEGFTKDRFPHSLCELYRYLSYQARRPMSKEEEDAVSVIGWSVFEVEHPVMPYAHDVLSFMQARGETMYIVTKGDPEVQHAKMAKTDLAKYFKDVYVVPHKDAEVYKRVAKEINCKPAISYMIGDSVNSDVNPSIDAGFNAVYISSPDTWAFYETGMPHNNHIRLYNLKQLKELFYGPDKPKEEVKPDWGVPDVHSRKKWKGKR